MNQKQKTAPTGGDAKKASPITDNEALAQVADEANSLINRLTQATKQKKKGRYVTDCCGVRRWVED